MAESDTGSTSELTVIFDRATAHLENLVPQLDSSQLLNFYGLYKQATVGPCNVPRPGWFQIQAKQKWDAWHALGNMSQELAMQGYIRAITEIDPEWENCALLNRESKSWVAVSCLHNDEEEISDEHKTLLDWIKEGNEEKVWEVLFQDKSMLNVPDESGMLPIHWAADRGFTSIIRLLIDSGADKDVADNDGQTPLHYAACCGHRDVVEYLLSVGVKILKDNDGSTPKDIASEELVSLF